MEEKIKVGVFWVCDEGGKLDIIYDTEEYPADWQSDFGDEFIVYEKEHRDVWKKLSENFVDGKYAGYNYNDFPRGRVTFDSDYGAYMVDYDVKLKPALAAGLKQKIVEIFEMKKRVWQVEKSYKSKAGMFNV